MRKETFERRSRIPAPAAAVFRWHTLPGTLEKLIPPWEAMRVVEREGRIGDGARVVFRLRVGPFSVRWVSVHRDYQEGRQFKDVQVQGPFAHWEHTHLVEPDGPSSCFLVDRIEYALPLGPLGRFVAGAFVRRKLERLFDYRHRVTAEENARASSSP